MFAQWVTRLRSTKQRSSLDDDSAEGSSWSQRSFQHQAISISFGSFARAFHVKSHRKAEKEPEPDTMAARLKLAPTPLSPLSGRTVYLRAPHLSDCSQWVDLRGQSADFLQKWEPVWPSDDLSRKGYERRLKYYRKDMKTGRFLPFFIFSAEDHSLVGGVNVSNIRRGVCQSASLGYWIGQPHAGQGYMTAALSLLVPYLLNFQALHRIEAACIPSNQASITLLKKMGFTQEGYLREYLCINGNWEDHLLFSFLKSDL